MKKIFNFLKTHYLLFSVLTLYIIIPFVLIVIFHFSAHSLEFVSENIISVLSGILAYIGTTVLGIVSVWQNKKAFFVNNRLMHLQKSEFEKSKSSIIRFKKNVEFSVYEFEKEFFTQSQKLPQNFFILAEDNYIQQNNRVECVDFYFDSIGYEISKIKIEEVTVKTANLQKKYKSLYEKTKTGFCYDFETNSYKMSLLLFCDKMYLQSNAEKNDIDFDLKINLYSKANVESSVHITIMLKDFAKTNSVNSVMYYYYDDEIVNKNNT